MIESYLVIDDFYEFQSNSSKRNQPGRFTDFEKFWLFLPFHAVIPVTAWISRHIFKNENPNHTEFKLKHVLKLFCQTRFWIFFLH